MCKYILNWIEVWIKIDVWPFNFVVGKIVKQFIHIPVFVVVDYIYRKQDKTIKSG